MLDWELDPDDDDTEVGFKIVTGDSSGVIRMYDHGHLEREEQTFNGPVRCVIEAAGLIISVHDDGGLCGWTRQLQAVYKIESRPLANGQPIRTVDCLGGVLAVGSDSGKVAFFRVADGIMLFPPFDLHSPVTAVGLVDESTLFTAVEDGTVTSFDISHLRIDFTPPLFKAEVVEEQRHESILVRQLSGRTDKSCLAPPGESMRIR